MRRRKEEVKASALSVWRRDREKDGERVETLQLQNSPQQSSGGAGLLSPLQVRQVRVSTRTRGVLGGNKQQVEARACFGSALRVKRARAPSPSRDPRLALSLVLMCRCISAKGRMGVTPIPAPVPDTALKLSSVLLFSG
ncbi:hypothetical protein AMELA_G00248080 [Ameiurus melas]|uniref:Uncharacterized protein n=1 Tax=Ameiurus melas TaxID=219545 RepID=A0A7J5ZTK2_AMEME|nr:hypothetical protein AMELA_G00248080 [Ameiurus melas]